MSVKNTGIYITKYTFEFAFKNKANKTIENSISRLNKELFLSESMMLKVELREIGQNKDLKSITVVMNNKIFEDFSKDEVREKIKDFIIEYFSLPTLIMKSVETQYQKEIMSLSFFAKINNKKDTKNGL